MVPGLSVAERDLPVDLVLFSAGLVLVPLVEARLSFVLGALAQVGDALTLIGRPVPRVGGLFSRVGPCFTLVGQPVPGCR